MAAGRLTYAERLRTFDGCWDEDLVTARQLSAIGHVCDRPPLEALDQGSHCISCYKFVTRALSVRALSGGNTSSSAYEDAFGDFSFHQPSCTRLQVRIPLEPQTVMGLHGFRMADVRAKWERRIGSQHRAAPAGRLTQSSSLFRLPTELRLEIYNHLLPELRPITPIAQLHRDSARVIANTGYEKTGPRNTTKVNLLRTCRAVHEEALDLLYSSTTFKFFGKDGTKILYLFLRSIGQSGRDLIKSVDVQCGNREDAIAFALLASCQKLQTMTIRLPRHVILFSRPPIWCTDGMSSLLALSGLKEVRFEMPDSRHPFMSDEKPDSRIIRRELTRSEGTPGDVSSLGGYLDFQPSCIGDRT